MFIEQDYLKIGDWAVAQREIDVGWGKFEPGSLVKIIGIGDRGYDIEDGEGHRMIECGWDFIKHVGFTELIKKIYESVVQQAKDIFEFFHAVPHFSIAEATNSHGGNPELFIIFSYTCKLYEGKTKKFVYRPASQTETGFIQEIRSYLLDCVDTFINMGY